MTYFKRKNRALAVGLIALALGLTGCAGKGAKKENAENVAAEGGAAKGNDITRPPQTIVGRKEVKESDPNETISYDEWRKKRLEELKAEDE